MRITFLLLGRYPTDKAYGITTSETIRCLVSMGNEITVFSIQSKNEGIFPTEHYRARKYRETWLSEQLRKVAYADTNLVSRLSWLMYWYLIKLQNRKQISSAKADIIWIRDFQALNLVPRKSNLVFEIHQQPKKSWRLPKKITQRFGKSVIAPISKRIQKSLFELFPDMPICYAPMGVRKDQVTHDERETEFTQRIEKLRIEDFRGLRIGYIGKFFPNGYSKGVEDLLGLAILNKKQNLGYRIAIKGGQWHEVKHFESLARELGIQESDLEISAHMNHSLALTEMSRLDVIVLTSPTSPSYVGFPLKAIESVATGRIVVAANCQTYGDIFDSKYQPYWYSPANPEDLLKTILRALTDPVLKQNISLGIDFASHFLWENRTRRIISAIEANESGRG